MRRRYGEGVSEGSNGGGELDPVQSATQSGIATYAILAFASATAGTVILTNYDRLRRIAEETPGALDDLIKTLQNILDDVV